MQIQVWGHLGTEATHAVATQQVVEGMSEKAFDEAGKIIRTGFWCIYIKWLEGKSTATEISQEDHTLRDRVDGIS